VQGTQTREGKVFCKFVNFCIACGIVVRFSIHFMIPCALFIITVKTVLSFLCEDSSPLGYDVSVGKLLQTFQRSLMPPYSGYKWYLVILKMEASSSSETKMTVYQPTHHHIPEDLYFHHYPARTSDLAMF
jgi:hypothetical protein